MFIFLSSCQFSFHTFQTNFSRHFATITYNIYTQYILKRTCVLYLVMHVTDTELSVHVYRSDTASQTALQLPREFGLAVSAHSCVSSQTVHGTQNRLWMYTAIERNMEQNRHCMCNVTIWCVRVTIVAVNKYYTYILSS